MSAGRRAALAAWLLFGAGLFAPVQAQTPGSRPGPLTDLANWIVDTYDQARARAQAADQAAADAAMLKEQEAAEKAAEQRCRNAISRQAQYDCIEARSDAFEQARGRRFAPGEARFKVLAYLKQRLAAAEQPAPPNAAVALIDRVGARCRALPEPQRGHCLTRYEACLVIHRKAAPEGRTCLGELDGIIDKSDTARRGAAAAAGGKPAQTAVPVRGHRDPACSIFDDASRSMELSELEDKQHMALLLACT